MKNISLALVVSWLAAIAGCYVRTTPTRTAYRTCGAGYHYDDGRCRPNHRDHWDDRDHHHDRD